MTPVGNVNEGHPQRRRVGVIANVPAERRYRPPAGFLAERSEGGEGQGNPRAPQETATAQTVVPLSGDKVSVRMVWFHGFPRVFEGLIGRLCRFQGPRRVIFRRF